MAAWTGVLLLAGCLSGPAIPSHATDAFEQGWAEADILWVVDGAATMRSEREALADAAPSFLDELTEVDVHLGVISTDLSAGNPEAAALLGTPSVLDPQTPADADAFRQRLMLEMSEESPSRGLQAVITALSPEMIEGRNAGFLGFDRGLYVVVVSNRDDCSDGDALGADATDTDCAADAGALLSVPSLVRDILGIHTLISQAERVMLAGILGPGVGGCDDSVPGERYARAVTMLGGIRSDICHADLSDAMRAQGVAASGMRSAFPLRLVPEEATLSVVVAPESGPVASVPQDETDGWTYNGDPAAPQIVFHGSAIPDRGVQITVEYVASGEIRDPI